MQRELGPLNLAHIFVADALDELCEHSDAPPNVGEVAVRLNIDPSRASRMVASAIRAGFAKRIASQVDGRRAHLALTADGRRALAAVRRFRIMFFSTLMANWSDDDCAELAKLLLKFTDSLPEISTELESGASGRQRPSRRTATGTRLRAVAFRRRALPAVRT